MVRMIRISQWLSPSKCLLGVYVSSAPPLMIPHLWTVSMRGHWGFSHLLVSMSSPTIVTWPFQSKAVFEVVLLTVSYILTWHSTSPLSSTSQKYCCLFPAVAQRLESSTKNKIQSCFDPHSHPFSHSYFFLCYSKKKKKTKKRCYG